MIPLLRFPCLEAGGDKVIAKSSETAEDKVVVNRLFLSWRIFWTKAGGFFQLSDAVIRMDG